MQRKCRRNVTGKEMGRKVWKYKRVKDSQGDYAKWKVSEKARAIPTSWPNHIESTSFIQTKPFLLVCAFCSLCDSRLWPTPSVIFALRLSTPSRMSRLLISTSTSGASSAPTAESLWTCKLSRLLTERSTASLTPQSIVHQHPLTLCPSKRPSVRSFTKISEKFAIFSHFFLSFL